MILSISILCPPTSFIAANEPLFCRFKFPVYVPPLWFEPKWPVNVTPFVVIEVNPVSLESTGEDVPPVGWATTFIVPPLRLYCEITPTNALDSAPVPGVSIIYIVSLFHVCGGLGKVTLGAVKVGTVIVGLDTTNEIIGGNPGSFTVGPVTVGGVIDKTVAFILGGVGATTEISGFLNNIASGCSGAIGFLSAIVIAPFETCLGLTPAFTSNATIGSSVGFISVKPYPLFKLALLFVLADVISSLIGRLEYCLLEVEIYLSFPLLLVNIPSKGYFSFLSPLPLYAPPQSS